MKRCQFDSNSDMPCPVAESTPYALLRETCKPDEYGQYCASILAQIMVADTVRSDTFESSLDDDLGLINARFRLTIVPESVAPADISKSMQHMSFPLREGRPDVEGKVAVHHTDLVLSLMNGEMLAEANWYDNYQTAQDEGESFEWWLFDANEGILDELSEPKGSVAEYDQSFRTGSAALWNSSFPPLLVVHEARKPIANYLISEYFPITK